MWDDGTDFDFGSNVSCTVPNACFPWSGTGPDDHNDRDDSNYHDDLMTVMKMKIQMKMNKKMDENG